MLSEKAIAVLKKIHTNGLQVLWSFQNSIPYYGTYPDGEEMPSDDWAILKRELESYETKNSFTRTSHPTATLIRIGIENNHKYNRTYIIAPDGSKMLVEETVEGLPYETPDVILYENQINDAGEGVWLSYNVWKSDYLIREKIDMDDVFEQKIGLLDQYTLTPLALEVINADSTQ